MSNPDTPWIVVKTRRPGESIPNGVSLTETPIAYYLRIRQGYLQHFVRMSKIRPGEYSYEFLNCKENGDPIDVAYA